MKYLLLVVTNTIISTLLYVYLYYSQTGSLQGISNNALLYFLVLICGNELGFGIWVINRLLRKLWTYKNQIALRILSNVIILSVFGAIVLRFLLSISINTLSLYGIANTQELNTTDLNIQIGILGFTVVFLYTLIDFLFFSYKNYMQIKVKTIEQQKEKSELQLEMLQKQLSPHYLFNSLNTISSLMDYDAKATEMYIRNLVKTYQYIIAINQKELVALKDELDMIKAYQYQLNVRFGDNIKWEFNVDDSLEEKRVPPLSLQVLIENAVKHNIASATEPLTIKCYTKTAKLVVENNITRSPSNITSYKIGLNNLQRRYALIGDEKIRINKQQHFAVELPLIN